MNTPIAGKRSTSRRSEFKEFGVASPTEKKYDLETEAKCINKNLTTLGRIF